MSYSYEVEPERITAGFASLLIAFANQTRVRTKCECCDGMTEDSFEDVGVPTGLRAVNMGHATDMSISVGNTTYWSTCHVSVENVE